MSAACDNYWFHVACQHVYFDVQDQTYGFKLTHLSQDDKAALSCSGESPAMLAEQVYQTLMQGLQTGEIQGFQHLATDPDIMGFRSRWASEKTIGNQDTCEASM